MPSRNMQNVYTVQFSRSASPDPTYSDTTEGGDTVDIEKYLDRLDQDRRESEQRITENQRLSEERYQKQRDEDVAHRRESEERYQEQRKEDEARHREWMTNTDARFEKMDKKLDDIAIEVRNEGRESKRWLLSTFIAVAAMAIATIVGIVVL